jgi:hypothetical protein
MSNKDGPARHFEVEDPVEAFHKLEHLAKRVVSLPKIAACTPKSKIARRRAGKRK